MQTFGYSQKPLAEKLGLKPNIQAVVLNPPSNYKSLLGKEHVFIKTVKKVTTPKDFIHAFYTQQLDIPEEFENFVKNLNEKGMIWISWPKKTSSVKSDLDENIVRETGLKLGVVDVKVCAIDETWSGLKFLRRKK